MKAINVLYLDTMTNYSSLRSALASGITFGVAGLPKQDRRAQSVVGCLPQGIPYGIAGIWGWLLILYHERKCLLVNDICIKNLRDRMG